jgi:homoserine O-acetyltransferase
MIRTSLLYMLFLLPSTLLLADDDLKQNEGDYSVPHYQFRNGQTIDNLNLHYTTLGTPQKDEQGNITNAVVFLHPTTSSGLFYLTPDFKTNLFGPGKPFDANKYYLIFPDSIGAGKSSKPSNGLKMKFPNYGYQDMVDLQHKVIFEKLGIKHVKYVIGVSMGGMHTWLWAVLYPNDIDGAMPIGSLPERVTGRNLIWRYATINAIKQDPTWDNGNYTKQPPAVESVWAFFLMMLDGVPHMQATVTDVSKAGHFIEVAEEEGSKKDANDLIYVIDAVRDYDPQSKLGDITASLYSLNFTDDQLNPYYLHIAEDNITKVKNGKAVTQQGNAHTFGHLTIAHPELWQDQATNFIQFVEANKRNK